MKLIFGFIVFVVLVAVTGGIYLFVRKADGKLADRTWLKGVPAKITKFLTSTGESLFKVFGSKREATTDRGMSNTTSAAT